MGSKTKPIISHSITADAEYNGPAEKLIINIYAPTIDQEKDVTCCVVELPFLFDGRKKIACVDGDQAIALAQQFVEDVLKGSRFRLAD